jgi:hypothetical protein
MAAEALDASATQPRKLLPPGAASLFDATSYGVKAAADFSRPKAAPALGDGDGASGDVLMFQLELERLLQSAAHAPPPTPFDQPRWATYRAYERRTADLRLASASDRTTTRPRIGANSCRGLPPPPVRARSAAGAPAPPSSQVLLHLPGAAAPIK